MHLEKITYTWTTTDGGSDVANVARNRAAIQASQTSFYLLYKNEHFGTLSLYKE